MNLKGIHNYWRYQLECTRSSSWSSKLNCNFKTDSLFRNWWPRNTRISSNDHVESCSCKGLVVCHHWPGALPSCEDLIIVSCPSWILQRVLQRTVLWILACECSIQWFHTWLKIVIKVSNTLRNCYHILQTWGTNKHVINCHRSSGLAWGRNN